MNHFPMEIEYANARRKFTEDQIRSMMAESKAYWSSPEGIAEKRRQDERNAAREYRGIKFPELAARGTAPSITTRSTPAPSAPAPRVAGWKKLFEIIS
jgi:hypothetical protein